MGINLKILGLNKFSDLTQEEFRSIFLINLSQYALEEQVNNKESVRDFIHQEHQKHNDELEFLDLEFSLPNNFDSRDKGWIGVPRNQGECGSCWLCQQSQKQNMLQRVELQQIQLNNNQLIVAREMPSAFRYLKANRATEEYLYPYTGRFGTCQNKRKLVAVGDYIQVGQNEQSIKNAIMQHGSLAIAVDANEWYTYENRIFNASSKGQVNHAVNAIGWGIENGTKYFVVRNSWGTDWGENGYIRLDPSNIFYDCVFAIQLA